MTSKNKILQKKCAILLLICATTIPLSAQLNSFPESYRIDNKDIERARKVISTPLKGDLVFPNPHKEAQWYPNASLGLFMHWGIQDRKSVV